MTATYTFTSVAGDASCDPAHYLRVNGRRYRAIEIQDASAYVRKRPFILNVYSGEGDDYGCTEAGRFASLKLAQRAAIWLHMERHYKPVWLIQKLMPYGAGWIGWGWHATKARARAEVAAIRKANPEARLRIVREGNPYAVR